MAFDDVRDLLPFRNGYPAAGKALILHEIGRGGMAVVYAGWHEDLDIPVAIKFLQTPEDRREEFISRFRLGTPAYMSPEQLSDPGTVDSASDIFSLGSTAYTLLTGQAPFPATTLWELITQIMSHPFPDIRLSAPGISDTMAGILERMTEKERGKRIHDACGLLGALPDAPRNSFMLKPIFLSFEGSPTWPVEPGSVEAPN